MALNAQRKALLAVAGVACLAVAADQLLLGGAGGTPQGATAAVSDAVTSGGSPAAPPSTVAPGIDTPAATTGPTPVADAGPGLGERLRDAEALLAAETPDAFAPRGRWSRATSDGPATTEPAAERADPVDPAAFAARYPLQGVIFVGLEPQAIVGGKPMRVGERCGGVTLEAIGDRWVVWSNAATRFRVRLEPGR